MNAILLLLPLLLDDGVLEGRVTSSARRLPPGATISVYSRTSRDQVAPQALGEAGEFRFEGLLEGDYVALARAPGHRAVRADVRTGGGPVLLELRALPSADVTLLDDRGRSVEATRLVLRRVAADDRTLREVHAEWSGPPGRPRVSWYEAGTHRLEVHTDAGLRLTETFALPAASTGAPLVLRLAPGSALAGAVDGPDGTPVAGARVEAWTEDLRFATAWCTAAHRTALRETSTDAEGRFRIDDLPDVGVVLRVAASNLAPRVMDCGLLRPGATRDLGAIELVAGGRAVGIVRLASGEPIAGALVRLSFEAESREATSDELGVVEFEHLPPGSVRAYIVPTPSVSPVHARPAILEVRDGEDTRFRLLVEGE